MIVPGSAHALLLSTSGYTIPYSLRFRAANSAYLSRTLSAPTDGKKYTFSAWVKFGDVGTTGSQYLISSTGGTYEGFFRDSTTSGARTAGALSFFFAGGTVVGTTALLRDPSAWYHVILSV
ncbi:MAG: hypothetical protein KJS95_09830, partial [Gammaproteobacteria bacterium]|nr:hypothetical protein [Gammaproteobacteria bacterium]